jgi:hypothetical protein
MVFCFGGLKVAKKVLQVLKYSFLDSKGGRNKIFTSKKFVALKKRVFGLKE